MLVPHWDCQCVETCMCVQHSSSCGYQSAVQRLIFFTSMLITNICATNCTCFVIFQLAFHTFASHVIVQRAIWTALEHLQIGAFNINHQQPMPFQFLRIQSDLQLRVSDASSVYNRVVSFGWLSTHQHLSPLIRKLQTRVRSKQREENGHA